MDITDIGKSGHCWFYFLGFLGSISLDILWEPFITPNFSSHAFAWAGLLAPWGGNVIQIYLLSLPIPLATVASAGLGKWFQLVQSG